MALAHDTLIAIIAADGDMSAVLGLIAPEFRAAGGDAYLDSFALAAAKGWPIADIVKLADILHNGLTVSPARFGGPVSITPSVRAEVIARDGYICTYCDRSVTIPHLDHVVPRARGGPSTPDNLVVSCQACNASKKDRPLEEWRGRK